MANNITTSAGTIATDEVAGLHHQLMKLVHGDEDSVTRVTAATPLPARPPGLTPSVLGDGAVDSTADDSIVVPAGTQSVEFFNLSDVIMWLSWTGPVGVGATGSFPVPAMSGGVAGYYAAPVGMSGTLRVKAASGSAKAYTCIRGA